MEKNLFCFLAFFVADEEDFVFFAAWWL